jgi:hypothetical protein
MPGKAVNRVPYLVILAAFAASRILYYEAGVRFQVHLVQTNFQFIDVELMKHRLLESLFYYHMYPPLHNLIVGVIVKVFPTDYGPALHALFIAVGAVSAVLLFELMRYLDVPVWLACLLDVMFITSPGCVLFENFPMYEYLIVALLLAQCVVLHNLLTRPRFPMAFLFFSLIAALALLRAFYHLFYVIALAAALALYLRAHTRVILAASAMPVLLVFAVYAKNLAVFGIFAGSSWIGPQLDVVTTHQLSVGEREKLIAEGKLSPIARVTSVSPPAVLRAYVPAPAPTGIPVLDQEYKSSGIVNFNNQIYLKTGPLYVQAAKQVFRYYPVAYVRSVLIAWFCYFRPPTDFFQFEENRAPIRKLDRTYNLLMFGQLREAPGTDLRALRAEGDSLSLVLYTGILLLIGLPLIVLATAGFWVRDYRGGTRSANDLALIAFILIQIVIVAVLSNFLSSFENNRYRFPTDPLYLTLAGVLITRLKRGRA